MPIAIGMEQQVQVKGADGTILWTGTAIVGVMYHVTNGDAAAIGMAEAVRADEATGAGTSVIPRLETTVAGTTPASDLPQTLLLRGKRVSATTDKGWLGVALEPVGVGKIGYCAGPGSITTVRTTTGALTFGDKLGGTATAGRVGLVTTGSLTVDLVLGKCIKINTAAGTGDTSHAGVLITCIG